MTADSTSFDPYRSPSLPEGPYAGLPRVGRPGKLTTLCVLCIVLGALGLMNSLLGAAGAVGGRAFQAWIQPKSSPGIPQEMNDAQQKLNDDMAAVQEKYFWALVPALAFRFIAALLLLTGGLRSLSLNEGGRKLLLIACFVALVFELLHTILQSIMTLESMASVNAFVEKVANLSTQGAAGKLPQTVVQVAIIGIFLIALLIALLKMALYGFGLIYLQRKPIRDAFRSGPRPSLAPSP